MLQGYEMIEGLCTDLSAYLDSKAMPSVGALVGASLPYFDTHAGLVERQAQSKRHGPSRSNRDAQHWKGDIARETKDLLTD